MPHSPTGVYAPALPPAMAAAQRHYVVEPAAIGANRWHIGYDDARARYIVQLRRADDLPCCDVIPTAPGLRAALKLADAINRAYGIDPVEGYDVSPRVFGALG